jgi:hypothetical protein
MPVTTNDEQSDSTNKKLQVDEDIFLFFLNI